MKYNRIAIMLVFCWIAVHFLQWVAVVDEQWEWMVVLGGVSLYTCHYISSVIFDEKIWDIFKNYFLPVGGWFLRGFLILGVGIWIWNEAFGLTEWEIVKGVCFHFLVVVVFIIGLRSLIEDIKGWEMKILFTIEGMFLLLNLLGGKTEKIVFFIWFVALAVVIWEPFKKVNDEKYNN